MPLRLDIKKKLSARSDRVKSVDFHPTEAWTLSALYSGNVFLWDYNNQTLVKQIEVCNLPVRCAKFVTRKQWILTASDDMTLRAFNYNTLEKVHEVEAHSDYVRFLAVHTSLPYVLSSSDDMTIKLWDWDKNFSCQQIFEGHAHYVMMVHWNPKDTTIFASCSLDRSLKIWGATGGKSQAHFSLTGHARGVNCVEYAPTGEKPYLISGSDDKTIKIWDYQTRQCINTLEGHTNNVTTALFHPQLPIILSGSEDGSVKIWHSATYRQETTLNYLLERVWSICVLKGSNAAAIGYDEGTVVIKMGSDEPIASMNGGKVIFAKGNEIQTANLKQLTDDAGLNDGERLALSMKDMGAAELFPQKVAHHPNGRLFAVCGDGEWVIYTSQVLRNKSFGSGVEFVWAQNGNYAVRDAAGKISVYQDFKEHFSFKPPFAIDEIYGGTLLAAKGPDFVCFYDWAEYRLVRRIDVLPKQVVWSEDGTSLALVCADSYYLLKYDAGAVAQAVATGQGADDDGIEAAFDLLTENSDKVSSATFVGECFVYISQNRIQAHVAGSTDNLAHLDREQYILGYLPEQSKIYVIDKELNVTPYTLHLSFIQYQSCIMRSDEAAAEVFFAKLPESMHTRVARFLESQGHQAKALEVSKDDEHRFDLAVQLGKLAMAADIIKAISAQATAAVPPKSKWKHLGDVALEQGDFVLARRCYKEAKDLSGLFLLQTASCDADDLKITGDMAEESGITNIAVLCRMLLGDTRGMTDVLVKANRLPEAAFCARTYCPSQLAEIVDLWKKDLSNVNKTVADALADPQHYPDLFPDFALTVAAENTFKARVENYPSDPVSYLAERELLDMNVIEEMKTLGVDGFQAKLLKGGKVGPPTKVPAAVPVTPAQPPDAPVIPAAPEPKLSVPPATAESLAAPEADLLGDFSAPSAPAPAASVDLLGDCSVPPVPDVGSLDPFAASLSEAQEPCAGTDVPGLDDDPFAAPVGAAPAAGGDGAFDLL